MENNIKEILILKKNLEKEITSKIVEFEKNTGLRIVKISKERNVYYEIDEIKIIIENPYNNSIESYHSTEPF